VRRALEEHEERVRRATLADQLVAGPDRDLVRLASDELELPDRAAREERDPPERLDLGIRHREQDIAKRVPATVKRLVGRGRFELPVSWSQTRRPTRLGHRPTIGTRVGAPVPPGA